MDYIQPPDLTFLTDDHPEAGGRTPLAVEQEWGLYFTLEDGRILAVKCGGKAISSFRAMLREMDTDDAIEAAFLTLPEAVITGEEREGNCHEGGNV